MTIILIVAGLAVSAWLLVIVDRQDVREQLPWFACYVAWQILQACTQLVLWLISRQLYADAYWWMEAVEIALIVAAVRESFLRMFQGFTARPGFRWSVGVVIAGVVFYSGWKAIYAPPVQSTRLVAFVVGAEFTFRWGIAGIGLLAMVFSWLLKEPTDTREDAVVTGFGLASLGFLVLVMSRSLFGTRYIFFTQYAPSVGYFLAEFLWIRVFSRPLREFGLQDLGMEPEEIAKEMGRYRAIGERITRKKW